MTHFDHSSHRPQRFASLAAILLAGQVLTMGPVWAQDAAQPAPTQSAPTQPAPAQPAPVQPTQAEPAPVQPAPTQPVAEAPAQPAATPPAAEAPAEIPAQPAAQPVSEGTAPPADAAPADAAAPAPADPAAGVPADATTDAPVTAPVTAVAPEPEPVAVEPPMPNPLEDPAGAITHIFSRPEANAALPHDLSPWGMFRQADIVVKAVMLGLVLASLATWTVFVAKTVELSFAKRRARATLRDVHRARSLDEAIARNGDRGGPAGLMLRAAQAEVEVSEPAIDYAGGDGLKERVDAALRRIEAGAGRKISVGTGILATIGSISPFVGLFGTVWGIMNSFIGISKSQTTNLAIVAPGIAEALLATAIGLVAAIPAVIIYNHFARTIARYKQILSDAAVGTEILVSRDLDFRKIPEAQVTPLRAAAE